MKCCCPDGLEAPVVSAPLLPAARDDGGGILSATSAATSPRKASESPSTVDRSSPSKLDPVRLAIG